jgi:hypothetical protein
MVYKLSPLTVAMVTCAGVSIILIISKLFFEIEEHHTIRVSEFSHCKRVYLDIGSNIGIQVRKLFEPSRYPGASVLPLFDQYFGLNRHLARDLCAIGVEMNPKHTMRLSVLEKHYTETCGYHVRFFKETAASTHNGLVDFWIGGNQLDNGASQYLKPADRKTKNTITAHALDLVEFILREIVPIASVIVMKMDIEGSEFELLPQLVMKGAICRLDMIFVETHPRLASSHQLETYKHASALIGNVPGCKVRLNELDDETYQEDVDDKVITC